MRYFHNTVSTEKIHHRHTKTIMDDTSVPTDTNAVYSLPESSTSINPMKVLYFIHHTSSQINTSTNEDSSTQVSLSYLL